MKVPTLTCAATLLLALTSTLLQSVNSQSSVMQCHCHINRDRSKAVNIACTRHKNVVGRLECSKGSVRDQPGGYQFVSPWGLFRLYRTHLTWDAARNVCKRHGGELAVPRDNATAAVLGRLVKDEPAVDSAFVGIHDIMTEGIFYGVDGGVAPYQEWRFGEPGHGSDDDTCVAMTDDGRLDGLKCEVAAPFLCERRQEALVPQGYQYVSGAGAFLRLYASEKLAYTFAVKVCEADGGALAVPDTWERAEAMLRLVPPDAGHVFLGLTDVDSEGDFVTSDKSRHLSQMEFDMWEPGQPDNGDGYGYEDCLALHPNGTLFDMDCETKLAFLCELSAP